MMSLASSLSDLRLTPVVAPVPPPPFHSLPFSVLSALSVLFLQDVLPLMQKWNVDAYMDGHDHTLQVLGSDNIRYYVSGGGCKKESHVDTLPQTVFAKADRGFMVHTISAANMTVRVSVCVCRCQPLLLHHRQHTSHPNPLHGARRS